VVCSRPGANSIRSRSASERHFFGSFVPCSAAISLPDFAIAFQMEFWHFFRLPLPQ
jgi:hypothetical protein